MHQEVYEKSDPSTNHLGAEPVSLDVDYASPISVLETAFVEDASSSSENSERVSAELKGMKFVILCLYYLPGSNSFSMQVAIGNQLVKDNVF